LAGENARSNPPPAPVPESHTHESGGCYPNDEWAIGMNPGDDFCFSTGVYFWQLIARPHFNLETKV